MGETWSEKTADVALWSVLVLAPVAGGSSDPRVLPVLAVMVAIATGGALLARARSQRKLSLPTVSAALGLLALLCLVQTIPLPVEWLTAHAADVHRLAQSERAPITYEVGSTLLEATKLLLYAQVALLAHNQARSGGAGFRPVAQAIVVSGVAVFAVGLFHQVFQLERLFGFLPLMRPAHSLITAFVNPNHTAGFMTLTALTALGLAAAERERRWRAIFLAAAAMFAGISIYAMSKGGLLALGLGLMVFAVFLPRTRQYRQIRVGRPLVVASMVALLPLVALFAAQERITKELGSAEIIERGLRAKLRTVVDAWPMIADHPWLGIGRGAFISVHTGYKSSEEQLLYVFPENIVAQLVVEWGWPVALGCLLALVVALATRLLRVSHSAKLGALAGLCAVVFQNLVDFSLELPGVAVIAAAILGGTGGMIFRDHRAQPSAWRRMAVVGSAASIAVIALGFWGLVAGTPRLGAEALDRAIAARRSDQPSLDAAEVEAIAARHPASADIAARVAFWAEVSRPPDFPKAFHWANRALYLAPNYADAHLLSGRLLVKAGYRKQGFEAMRRGWELSASDRRQSFIDEVIRLAVTSTEALLATPRRDPELDLPSEAELLRLARQVARRDRAPWIADVLEQIRDFELLSSEHLQLVARLAENEGAWPVAARALAALERRGPLAPRAAQLQVELVRQTQGATAAIAALDALLAQPQQATVELLRTRLDLAIAQKDLARAQAVLAEMEVLSRADYRGQADLEHDRARVALAEGRTAKAARALGRALQLDPTNIRWRLERARALIVLNRHAEAGVELKFVLDVHPGHAGAVALLRGLSKAPIP